MRSPRKSVRARDSIKLQAKLMESWSSSSSGQGTNRGQGPGSRVQGPGRQGRYGQHGQLEQLGQGVSAQSCSCTVLWAVKLSSRRAVQLSSCQAGQCPSMMHPCSTRVQGSLHSNPCSSSWSIIQHCFETGVKTSPPALAANSSSNSTLEHSQCRCPGCSVWSAWWPNTVGSSLIVWIYLVLAISLVVPLLPPSKWLLPDLPLISLQHLYLSSLLSHLSPLISHLSSFVKTQRLLWGRDQARLHAH
jgi:hypothetical protein